LEGQNWPPEIEKKIFPLYTCFRKLNLEKIHKKFFSRVNQGMGGLIFASVIKASSTVKPKGAMNS